MSAPNEPLHLEDYLNPSDMKPSLEGHIWKQRGVWLVCTTCVREHGTSITAFGAGPTDIYLGLEDGKPKFKSFEQPSP